MSKRMLPSSLRLAFASCRNRLVATLPAAGPAQVGGAQPLWRARSKSRPGQQGRDGPPADVVDAGISDAITHDVDQQRSVEPRAVEFSKHHREVDPRWVPRGFEIGTE